MINDLSKNSSMLAISALLFLSPTNVYCNSTQQPTELQYAVYNEQTTLPRWTNTNLNSIQQMGLSTTYHDNEEGGYMLDRNYRESAVSCKIISSRRKECEVQDLGYFEENQVENLEIKPRKAVKIKAKISNSKRRNCYLV